MFTQRLLFAGIVCVVAGFASAGCGDEAREATPTPPSMDALLAAYDNPTAPLTEDNAAEVLLASIELFGVFTETEAFPSLIVDLLGDAFGAGDEEGDQKSREGFAQRDQGLSLEADGFVRITRICQGWDGGTQPNPADGQIRLTAVATSNGLNPVIWGDMNQCRYAFGDSQALFNSALSIHVGEVGSGGEGLGTSPLLISLLGGFELDGEPLNKAYDFRLNLGSEGQGGLELRVVLENGRHVIFFPTDAGLIVRAQNGTWNCNFDQRTCTSEAGDTFTWQL